MNLYITAKWWDNPRLAKQAVANKLDYKCHECAYDGATLRYVLIAFQHKN